MAVAVIDGQHGNERQSGGNAGGEPAPSVTQRPGPLPPPVYALPAARIVLRADGGVDAPDVGDSYAARAGALAEARHVFLAGNDLPRRWRGRRRFTIGEIGFGCAINFLATWQTWSADPARCAALDYCALEYRPLRPADLAAVLAAQPELSGYARALLAAYPGQVAGVHRLTFAGGRVRLWLLHAEAGSVLAGPRPLDGPMDAWYLDGFAPARNASAWRPALLAALARHSAPDATLSSYSCAGAVRRGLAAAGFVVARAPGFAAKREMLRARRQARSPAVTPDRNAPRGPQQPPWWRWPAAPAGTAGVGVGAGVAVIGAGLAGCALAYSLAGRGVTVTLLERADVPARGASGVGAAVLAPRLTRQPDRYARFYLLAYLHTVRLLATLRDAGFAFRRQRCGVLQLAADDADGRRQRLLLREAGLPEERVRALDAAAAAARCGVPLARGGLWFPDGGWVDPAELCRALLRAAGCRVLYGRPVAALARDERERGWLLLDGAGGTLLRAGCVVIAGGDATTRFAQTAALPLLPVRGQTCRAPVTAASAGLRAVLSHSGYITPAPDGWHRLGATFQRGQHSLAARAADTRAIGERLTAAAPALAEDLRPLMRADHVGVRATTPDRLPLAGPVPDPARCREQYRRLGRGRDRLHASDPPPACLPGLYLAAGFGSRGAIAAPLVADVLAAGLTGGAPPLPAELVDALHPLRFLIRDLRRGGV